jgi:hypothetical protein
MKNLICLFLLFCFTALHAQTDKHYLIRSNIGYNYSHKDMLDAGNGFPTNGLFGQIDHEFNGSLSAGRRLNPNF